jgi:sugar/nucleoside kinase (ribokinase family)
MKKKFDVIVNGMINLDINVAGINSGFLNTKVTKIDQITLSLGGDAQNCALTLARSGYRTAICGRVGRDYAGLICKQSLEANGVDCNFLSISQTTNSNTGIAINLIQNGEAAVLFNEGVNNEFCLDDINIDLFKNAYIVCLNSFFCCGKIDENFFFAAKQAGAITVADTNTVMPENDLSQIAESLRYVDYFIPSYMEAKTLTGKTNPNKIADCLLEYCPGYIIIKLGEDGCLVRSKNTCFKQEGYKVNVIDTTGAGDNFVAGFIMGLCEGLPIKKCVQLANAAGAITVQSLGSNGGVTSIKQLKDFIKESKKRD